MIFLNKIWLFITIQSDVEPYLVLIKSIKSSFLGKQYGIQNNSRICQTPASMIGYRHYLKHVTILRCAF